MRRFGLAGLLPALMMAVTGCGEGETPATTGTTPAPATTPAAAPAATADSAAPSESAAAQAETAAKAPEQKPESVPATPIEPAVAATPETPAEENATVPATKLEEPAVPQELGVGDPAPAMTIATWVKGEPVQAFDPEKVHVVEFWATWCGPCLASMPHIASLQTEYGDKVRFIGISDEDAATVNEFMSQTARGSDKTWSELLTYTIALDDARSTNTAYMQAAGQNGIPCAFVVGRSGKVEWIGHPMSIDEPLKQIVDGTWDSEKARVDYLAAKELEKAKNEMGPRISAAMRSGDFKAALTCIDELLARFPNEEQLKAFRFQLLLQGEMNEEANKAAAVLIEAAKDQPMRLNQLAWMMVTVNESPGIDLNLAHSAAQRAAELTQEKDASILDTLARVTFRMGKAAEALELQKKAVELAPEEEQLKSALVEYEAALKAAAPEPPAEGQPAETPAEPKGDN